MPWQGSALGKPARRRLTGYLRELWREQNGSTLALFAFALPAMLGLGAIGVETGLWYVSKRAIQTQADAGALGGAFAKVWGRDDSEAKAAALKEAERNGYQEGDEEDIERHIPPEHGPYEGEESAFEVMIYRTHKTMLFAAIVPDDMLKVSTRAVAGIVPTGKACILALDEITAQSLTNSGNTTVNAPKCAIASNSTDDQAAFFTGSATVNVQTVWTAGDMLIDGNKAKLTTSQPPTTRTWPLEDPFAGTPIDIPLGACNSGNWSSSGTKYPGKYCGGIAITSSATINLMPGTYYIDQGNLTVDGNTTVTCTACSPGGEGVTFVLTSSGSVNAIGTVLINGSSKVVLNAPAEGAASAGPGDIYDGLLFYQDPRAPETTAKAAVLNGGTNTALVGATYFPSNQVTWSGNNTGLSQCTVIVADTVVLTGSSQLTSEKCDEFKVKTAVTTKVALIE
ncbi:MAG: hypothetical protein K0S81_2118 [Rhodospirillales bacterium]|jgi:hypothetical protein|nr:hypothetical protein [Rhodospirillales bacterium]